ncbi:hypothetical protein E2320_017416, partial [Naja naja]
MGPIGSRGNHNEPAEWQHQTAVCSQTFEGLPNQLEQLWMIYHCRRPSINISFASESGTRRAPSPPKWKKAPRKPEKSKFVCQAIKVPNPQQTTGEGTLAAGVLIVQDTDSEEDDPM